MSRQDILNELNRRKSLQQNIPFTRSQLEQELDRRRQKKDEEVQQYYPGIVDDMEIAPSNERSRRVEEYLTSPAFGRLVLEVAGGVAGTIATGGIGAAPLLITRAATYVRPALLRMFGAGLGEGTAAGVAQTFDPRESVTKEMLRGFATGVAGEGSGQLLNKAVTKIIGKNKKLIDGAEEAVSVIEQQKKKILENPLSYDKKVVDAAKKAQLTPGLLQEGQIIDLAENISELSLLGGGAVRYAREGAETVATTAIDDFVKTFKVAADPEDLGVIFQKTLSDDLDVFRGNTRALYKSLDKKLRKTNPYAVNISAIKKEAQKRLDKGIGLGTNTKLKQDLDAVVKLPDLISFQRANTIRSDLLGRSREIGTAFGSVNKQFATEYGKSFTKAMDKAVIPSNVRELYNTAQKTYKDGAEVFNTDLFKKILESEPDVAYKAIFAAGDRPVLVRKTMEIIDKRIKDKAVANKLRTSLRGHFLEDAIRSSQKSNVQYGQELDAAKLDNFLNKKSMTLKELFTPEQVRNLNNFKKTLAFSQGRLRKRGGLPGAIFIQMKQSGAVMKLAALGGAGAVGGVPAATTVILAPAVLGKMFTSPKIVKALTLGYKYNENQTLAGRTFRQIIAQMSKEGMIDKDEEARIYEEMKQGGYK